MKHLTQLFTLLSEPVRLQILAMLADGELCVCKIFPTLGLPQSTVSRHLALLRIHQIVATRRKGTWMHYRLSRETWPEDWRQLLEQAIEQAAKQHLQSKEVIRSEISIQPGKPMEVQP